MFLHFLQSTEDKNAFLELAHMVARIDGFVSQREQQCLSSYMAEMNVQKTDFTPSAERKIGDVIKGLKDDQVKKIFFAEILLLVFADGNYNDDEKQIVTELKQHFGFSEACYETFKDWVIRMDQLKIEGTKLILSAM